MISVFPGLQWDGGTSWDHCSCSVCYPCWYFVTALPGYTHPQSWQIGKFHPEALYIYIYIANPRLGTGMVRRETRSQCSRNVVCLGPWHVMLAWETSRDPCHSPFVLAEHAALVLAGRFCLRVGGLRHTHMFLLAKGRLKQFDVV